MKNKSLILVASFIVTPLLPSAEPEFAAVEGWLKPAAELETIGPSHGIDFNHEGNLVVSEFNRFGRVLRYDHRANRGGE